MSSVIVIEERLRTRALSIAVAAVALLVAAVEALVLSSSSSSTSWIAVVVVAAAFVSLSLVFVGSLKVIVRVLDERGGRTLEILYGPGPLIRQRFGADEIVEASAQQFSFTTIGGWG